VGALQISVPGSVRRKVSKEATPQIALGYAPFKLLLYILIVLILVRCEKELGTPPVSEFRFMYSSSKAPKSPIDEGIGPLKEFSLRYNSFNAVKSPIDVGSVPVSEFWSILNSRSEVISPILDGSVLSKLFIEKNNSFRLRSDDIHDGIDPTNSLKPKFMDVSKVSDHKPVGIAPVNELDSKSRSSSLVNTATSEGSEPVSPQAGIERIESIFILLMEVGIVVLKFAFRSLKDLRLDNDIKPPISLRGQSFSFTLDKLVN